MTVSSTPARHDYDGNGVTTTFPVGFRFLENAHLRVIRIVKATGVETVLTLDSPGANGYSVLGAGQPAGGSITTIAAPVGAGVTQEKITILCDPPIDQQLDYIANDPFPAQSHEAGLDKLTMICRTHKEMLSRALTMPESFAGSGILPTPSALKPLVWKADLSGLQNGEVIGSGDLLLRGNLASTNVLEGIGLVFPYIESLGAKGDGVTLDDAVFATAAALGRMIKLRDGATYYLSQRVVGVTGTRFICDGMCKIMLKTGPGGFNNKSLNTLKNENSVFFFSGVDDIGVQGVEFITDGVAEVTIYPVRVLGGTATRGCDFNRLRFKGLSLIAGGYLSLHSIGAGAPRYGDIEAFDCGSAQGNTYWTGTPQISVLEFDNDMVGGVPSMPGYGYNIRGTNILLTNTALTHYGQQSDIVNIAGISGTDRKGQTIDGVYADGVGEAVDLFCTGATIRGVRAKNVHLSVAKFVHGARHNHVEIDVVESCGQNIVTFAGSTLVPVHTEHNTCHIRTAKGVGDSGTGPTTSNLPAVLFQENGGTLLTCLPRNNIVTIDTLVGGANMDYVARDNCTINNTNNNLVRVTRATAFQLGFCTAAHAANMRVRYLSAQPCRMSIGAGHTLSTGVDTPLQYNTAQVDLDALADTVNFKIKPKYPGSYTVRAQVRISGNNATDYLNMAIKKGGALSGQITKGYATSSTEVVHDVSQVIYISETEVGTAAADLTISATHTGAASVNALNTASMSYFEVTPTAG